MSNDFFTDYFAQSDWLNDGLYGGRRIADAHDTFWTTTASASLSVQVLDAAYANDELAATLVGVALFDDALHGRVGHEWDEERNAIAEQHANDFNEKWPQMREYLHNLHMVSWVSAAENYVKAVLLEFSAIRFNPGSTPSESAEVEERMWIDVDARYRKAMKKWQSTSGAWVGLCSESRIPDRVKEDLKRWLKNGEKDAVDEMVLLRNAVIHRGALVGVDLGKKLRLPPNSRIRVTTAQMERYKRAFGDFTLCIDPTF